jgi:hypothetical protein
MDEGSLEPGVDLGPRLPGLQPGVWPKNPFNTSFVYPKFVHKYIHLALPQNTFTLFSALP